MSVRIAVCVAAVPNPEKIKWDRFRQLLDVQDAEPVLNPADRNALELAAQLSKSATAMFDVYCAGAGASAALREAAVFGAQRLVTLDDDALADADAAGVASALAGAITVSGGADVVLCGPATSSYGSGAVPGYLSAFLNAGLRIDAIALEPSESGVAVTSISGPSLVRADASFPTVIVAAPFGIAVRTISPILLMRAAKKPIETVGLAVLADALPNPDAPLPSTGASDGPLESNRKRRLNEAIDGPDAPARAITLVSALRERELV